MIDAQLFQNEIFKKLMNVRIASKSKIRGHHKGSHRSHKAGTSMDFSDYRAYHLGDDVRQIDWNVYARSEKYYIKRYLDEQEMRIQIVLDGTKSMIVKPEKWLFAKQIAAALGTIVLQREDRVQCSFVAAQPIAPFRGKGTAAKQKLLHTFNGLEEPSLQSFFSEQANKHLVKGQTILFIITDALEPTEQLEALIRRLPAFSSDIRMIQIVEEEVIKPSFLGDMELFDIETEQKVNVSISDQTLKKYLEAKDQHEKQLDALCKKYSVARIQLFVEEGFQQSFFHRLKKANWIE